MSHLTAKQLEKYKKQLLDLRSKVLNRMNNSQVITLSQEDMTDENDHAAAMVQQSVNLNVKGRELHMLKEIDHALSKFEEGTYGICEDTEEPIEPERLEANPYTRYSVEAAELREKRAKRYRGVA